MSKVTKEKVEKKVDENWDLVPTAPIGMTSERLMGHMFRIEDKTLFSEYFYLKY